MRCNIIRTRHELEAQRARKPKCRRWFGVVALLVAFLLIAGSIYLHLRQKSHYGRLHYHLSKSTTKSVQIVPTYSDGQINDYNYSEIMVAAPGVVADAPLDDCGDYYNCSDEYNNTEETERTNVTEAIVEDTQSTAATLKSQSTLLINETCLQCICETITECKPATCRDGACGRFRISLPYWTDAALSDMTTADYQSCVNDDNCARRVVDAYMRKYKQDCDGDGIIDCRDYIALHVQGPTGCHSEDGLPIVFQTRMDNCFMSLNY